MLGNIHTLICWDMLAGRACKIKQKQKQKQKEWKYTERINLSQTKWGLTNQNESNDTAALTWLSHTIFIL